MYLVFPAFLRACCWHAYVRQFLPERLDFSIRGDYLGAKLDAPMGACIIPGRGILSCEIMYAQLLILPQGTSKVADPDSVGRPFFLRCDVGERNVREEHSRNLVNNCTALYRRVRTNAWLMGISGAGREAGNPPRCYGFTPRQQMQMCYTGRVEWAWKRFSRL